MREGGQDLEIGCHCMAWPAPHDANLKMDKDFAQTVMLISQDVVLVLVGSLVHFGGVLNYKKLRVADL
jgi:hypothetical protein